MYKYQIVILMIFLISCSSKNKEAPMKLVNHSIPEQDSYMAFSIDSDYCTDKVIKDRPYVYTDCRYVTNPAMRKNCLNNNDGRLGAYKKLTKKLYIKCLAEKGWQEDAPANNVNGFIEVVERVAPIYPVEAISLCIEGKVKVGFTIAKDGTVKDVSILEAKPERIFDVAVINAVSTWRFKPIMANGELMEQYVVQELMFKPYEQCGQKIENPVD